MASAALGEIAVGWRTSRRHMHAALFGDPAELALAITKLGRRNSPVVFCRWTRTPSQLAARDDLETADNNP